MSCHTSACFIAAAKPADLMANMLETQGHVYVLTLETGHDIWYGYEVAWATGKNTQKIIKFLPVNFVALYCQMIYWKCTTTLNHLIMMTSRHQMETFSALLAICAGNSLVPIEFPAQRPVTWSFGVFFDLRLNKRLSKQSWGWWFEMLSRPLWRHCNDPEGAIWTPLNPCTDINPTFT